LTGNLISLSVYDTPDGDLDLTGNLISLSV